MTVAEDSFLGVVPLKKSASRGGFVKTSTSENAIFKDGCLCQLSLKMSDFRGGFIKSTTSEN
jgi:hypothetical protein